VLPGRCGKSCLERLHPTGQRSWQQAIRTCTRHLFPRIGVPGNGAALKFLARSAILKHAKRLGLLAGQTLIADSEAELTLVFAGGER
jgi:hypothetical protein